MNRYFFFMIIAVLELLSPFSVAIEVDNKNQLLMEKKEQYSAIEYLDKMQHSYKHENYELLYLSSLQKKLEPMQLIHGMIDGKEAVYFRYLNGNIRESLQFNGNISYFEQGTTAYTLKSHRNRSVFSNIASFNYRKGESDYEYAILGKGRIAGKQSIAIKMFSKSKYRHSYVIWCDLRSYLPLRLDTLNKSNTILEQVMVVSLNYSANINPWLQKLTEQTLPSIVHIPETEKNNNSQWGLSWLPSGFEIIKNDKHKLALHKNEPVSYILLSDGLVNVSIYISTRKVTSDENKKVIKRGASILYTEQKGDREINVVGDIPLITAKRLVESISLVKYDY